MALATGSGMSLSISRESIPDLHISIVLPARSSPRALSADRDTPSKGRGLFGAVGDMRQSSTALSGAAEMVIENSAIPKLGDSWKSWSFVGVI